MKQTMTKEIAQSLKFIKIKFMVTSEIDGYYIEDAVENMDMVVTERLFAISNDKTDELLKDLLKISSDDIERIKEAGTKALNLDLEDAYFVNSEDKDLVSSVKVYGFDLESLGEYIEIESNIDDDDAIVMYQGMSQSVAFD